MFRRLTMAIFRLYMKYLVSSYTRLNVGFLISVINQLDAQNFYFTVSLFHASTCFEHTCSSSGGQNFITQPPDDEHMCSKHVEA